MAFTSLLQRFRAKPRISTSDSTTRSTTYAEKLGSIWKTILDDTQRTLHQHQHQQLRRKREREEAPYLSLVDLLKECGLDANASVVKSIDKMYNKILESQYVDMRATVVAADQQFYGYRVAVRTAASTHLHHMDQIHTGYSNKHFDELQWNTLFNNEVWNKYCDGVDHTRQYDLLYNTVMYLTHGVHPRALTPTRAVSLAQEDVSRQNALKEELTKLRNNTKSYWPSLQVTLASHEKNLRSHHLLRNHVQPKVQKVLRNFDDCLKCVDRDPGYVPSNLSTLTFARGALKIIARYEVEVKRMNTKELHNLVAGFEASYDTSRSTQQHVMQDVDEYIKEWQKHKQAVMWERITKHMCERFEQSLKVIEEIQSDLGVLSEQPELVKDFASIHKVLKDDLVALQQVAAEAAANAAGLDRSSLATKQSLAEAPCLTMDGEEFAYNVGLTLAAVLNRDDLRPNEMQQQLTQALRNQSSKFEEMIENPSLCDNNNNYNHMQSKLAEKMDGAMTRVRAKLHEEIEPVVKTVDTWYLKHLNNILCHCIDSIKAYKNAVQPPNEFLWNEYPGIITLPVPLKEQALKHSQELAQRANEFANTLEPYPRIVLMPEMRQWAKQTNALSRNDTRWTLHDAWVYLDSVYKLTQMVQLDENELLNGV